MRVVKREFVREFYQFPCDGQTGMSVDESCEARVCTRVLSKKVVKIVAKYTQNAENMLGKA
jgi:hypothetical protein